MATPADFYQRVLEKNTFYYFDDEVEEKYDAGHITAVTTILLNLREFVVSEGVKRAFFDDVLKKEHGLTAILALNGLSLENLKRLTTVARAVNDPNLNELLQRKNWNIREGGNPKDVTEFSTDRIQKLVRTNDAFRAGLVNLFFEGASNTYLRRHFPPFHLKKLSIQKLGFSSDAILDTLVRYKEGGSHSGQKDTNADQMISAILDAYSIEYVSGVVLDRLRDTNDDTDRTMDFIIPNQEAPRIIIESSFVATTSSGMGDKAKTTIRNAQRISVHYPSALFVGFVDGIGWYVRKRDLRRITSAFHDVFTFHDDELQRFQKMLRDTFSL
ncbi:MAG: DpnII family type II restriction endonuclease [Chloroflexi bacterium]|nr:DpnII family type II restriction endonuclease [Chloroflexota bacterium]